MKKDLGDLIESTDNLYQAVEFIERALYHYLAQDIDVHGEEGKEKYPAYIAINKLAGEVLEIPEFFDVLSVE